MAADVFLSTPSARRATSSRKRAFRKRGHFYPRPPRGGRRCARRTVKSLATFLSTPSARRATNTNNYSQVRWKISIHALREEGDVYDPTRREIVVEFLSTPSARRATKIYRIGDVSRLISIHALREEGDGGAGRQDRDEQVISIHALREEGDRPLMITSSHLPYISIHALREEGDSSSGVRKSICLKFLSTPSARRATKTFVLNSVHGPVFLSTPSARRATAWKAGDDEKQAISIHALREEGDRATHVLWWMSWKFLSTPSARRATTSALLCLLLSLRFLSTPSARRATPLS